MVTYLVILIFISIISINGIYAVCSDFDNSEWKINGSNCGKFCADLLQPELNLVCDPKLEHLGCFCKDGFYRDKNLQCVLPEQCGHELQKPNPAPIPAEHVDCPYNELYDNCSSRCLEQCKNREDPISCPILCDSGCFCRGQRLRNNDGVCVAVFDCEPLAPDRPKPVCPQGEIFMKCGNRCTELCSNTRSLFGVSLDCNKCATGCFCEPPLLRGQKGTCVTNKKCDQKSMVGNVMSSIFGVLFKGNLGLNGRIGFKG